MLLCAVDGEDFVELLLLYPALVFLLSFAVLFMHFGCGRFFLRLRVAWAVTGAVARQDFEELLMVIFACIFLIGFRWTDQALWM